jgi:hypothetical protein
MGIVSILLVVLIIYVLVKHPEYFALGEIFTRKYKTSDDRYNEQKRHQQEEIDRILDKIHHSGIENLTPQEKETLDRFSNQ